MATKKRTKSIEDSLGNKEQKRELDLKSMEAQVKAIHAEQQKKEKNYRLSVDTPESVYTPMKVRLAQLKISVRDYIVDLIKRDLGA